MSVASDTTITALLREAAAGRSSAVDALFAHVYPELRRLARQVRSGRAGETLNTTALAHEAYLKLSGGHVVEWQERAHFFAVAARAMRQVLMDAARKRMAQKRGGDGIAISLDDSVLGAPMRAAELVALDDALQRLAAFDPRRAAVVEHRFFGGLTMDEIATVLDVSTATVERDWRSARAWLATELRADRTTP
jgi:RNA polymerase sigma factor (TIGR02999 family)